MSTNNGFIPLPYELGLAFGQAINNNTISRRDLEFVVKYNQASKRCILYFRVVNLTIPVIECIYKYNQNLDQ